MKRYIRQASELDIEKVAKLIPTLQTIVEDYMIHQGFDEKEVEDYYTFEMNSTGKNIILTLRAEISIDEFQRISSDLNEIVASVDNEAYFDAVTPGIYECVFEFSKQTEQRENSEDEDPVLNENNIRSTVDTIAKEVSKAVGIDFKVSELMCRKKDNEGYIRVYVELESDEYESLAYVDFDIEDVISVVQVKSELADKLYSKLINNIVSRY